MTTADRSHALERLEASYRLDRGTGCWLWTGKLHGDGFGVLHIRRGCGRWTGPWLAHRLAYALFKGELGAGQRVAQTCGNRLCVNPEHVVPYADTFGDARAYALQEFEARHAPEPNSGCWLWMGRCLAKGYGSIVLGERAQQYAGPWMAHRLSYALFRSMPPRGRAHHVCHRCDVPGCVNPAHLWLGTAADNERDKIAKGRRAAFTWKDRIARGSNAGQAKLAEDDIPRIYAMRAEGMTQSQVAACFGVSQRVISCIELGLTWKHVPRPR